jgi:hypothetical protein
MAKNKNRGTGLIVLGVVAICLSLGLERLLKAFSSGNPGPMFYLTLASGATAIIYGAILLRAGRP